MRALAGRYGTPLYVYQLDDVRAAAAELRAILPEPSRLYYSLKANPHPRLVAELAGLGYHAEISSVGELAVVEQVGARTADCLYTGPGKTRAEIAYAVRAGVRTFSVESEADHGRVTEVAEELGAQVETLVRLNPPAQRGRAGLRMAGAATQFGVGTEDFHPNSPLVKDGAAVRPRGLHLFSATNIAQEHTLIEELRTSIRVAATELSAAGLSARLLDLGGGFAAPYAQQGRRAHYPGLRAALAGSLDEHFPSWREGVPMPAFESGRYLVAESGSLVCTVLDVKTVRDSTYVVLDAGTNVLSGMSGVGRILPPAADIVPLSGPGCHDRPTVQVTVVGPLCTPLDVLSRARPQPVPAVGELVAVPNVGAYGASASLLGFLSRPTPAEVVLDGDEVVEATRRTLTTDAL
ncbi:type III PLP-dependent enzyme [Micromonospora sp. KC207]|nr:type III PLP-dependent enzyme [Micromonospora sp. KC207]